MRTQGNHARRKTRSKQLFMCWSALLRERGENSPVRSERSESPVAVFRVLCMLLCPCTRMYLFVFIHFCRTDHALLIHDHKTEDQRGLYLERGM